MKNHAELSLPSDVAEDIRSLIERRTFREPNSGCWLWEGESCGSGYPFIRHPTFGTLKNGSKRRIRGHRASYAAFNGPVPRGMLVCHKCDVRLCINPAHLFLGTDEDNNRDMRSKGRARTISGDNHFWKGKTVPQFVKPGELHNMAKLTEAQALEILKSEQPYSKLSAHYGVSKSTVCAIKRGQNWKHLQSEVGK